MSRPLHLPLIHLPPHLTTILFRLLLKNQLIVGDEGLHDAGLVGVIDQGGEGHSGLCGPWPEQRGPEHNAEVPGGHLVVLFYLHDPEESGAEAGERGARAPAALALPG